VLLPDSNSSKLIELEIWLPVSSSESSRNLFGNCESALSILKYTGRTDTTTSDFFSWSMVNEASDRTEILLVEKTELPPKN
jgi:hypothetical protein